MKEESGSQFMNLKIHQKSLHCALQNFKIDVDIAIEKTHSHENRIYWEIWQLFFYEMVKMQYKSVVKQNFWSFCSEKCKAINFLCFI
jgi:hypothetical protein